MPLPVDFKLYLITDRKQAKVPLPRAVRSALEGGIGAVQLREKDLPIRELISLARELRGLTREFGAKLIINDRADVAVDVGADGVHLGHASMPPAAVRRVVGPAMLIGVSTHTKEEALGAESGGADFVTFGPIFETPSKKGLGAPVGKEVIRSVQCSIEIPLFALGGINTGNALKVFGAGATGIAMISSVIAADDITKAARKFVRIADFMERIACNSCTPR